MDKKDEMEEAYSKTRKKETFLRRVHVGAALAPIVAAGSLITYYPAKTFEDSPGREVTALISVGLSGMVAALVLAGRDSLRDKSWDIALATAGISDALGIDRDSWVNRAITEKEDCLLQMEEARRI